MIQKLQKKFIAIVITAIALVILILLGSINVLKHSVTTRQADEMLGYLMDNGGRFPAFSPDDRYGRKPDKPGMPDINPDTGFRTRFFVVWVDEQGRAARVDTGHIASISSEEAVSYGEQIAQTGKSSGYLDSYRYGRFQSQTGAMLIFLDCSTELYSDKVFLLLSCGIGAATFLLVSLVAVLYSRRIIHPVQVATEKQSQFLADASHELKTPLAVISASNDVLELIGSGGKWTANIRNQVTRMDGLLKSMLELTRLDSANPRLQMEPLDLSALVLEAAEPFSVLAQANHVSLTLDIAPSLGHTGDRQALQHLISILLDNAVKYAGPEGAVQVRLFLRGKGPCLSVENTCTEPPAEDLNRLFDRFYRSDTSRSRETGGYGLGLSIAKSICQAHKAGISASTLQNGNICFEVCF